MADTVTPTPVRDTVSTYGIPELYSSENNGTNNQTFAAPKRDEDLVKVEIAIQAIIFSLAIFGNSVVLLALCLRRKKLSRMNLLIVHLSLADLFVAFFNILPQLIWDITFRFQGNDFLCRSVKFFQVVAMYASSYVLVTTAIDRYLAICHPLTSHTWSAVKIHMMVAVAWGLSLGFSVPQIIIFGYREILPGVHDCWGVFNPLWTVRLYVTWFFFAVYVIPTCILILAYGRICLVVWRSVMSKEPSMREKSGTIKSTNHSFGDKTETGELLNHSSNSRASVSRAKKASSNPRAHVGSLSRAKLKTIKLTMTVIVCYLVCGSPFFISQMWAVWDPYAPFQGYSMVIMMLLASLNSCTNPWIYLAFSDRLLWRCFHSNRRRYQRSTGTFDSEARTKMSTMSESVAPEQGIPLREMGRANGTC